MHHGSFNGINIFFLSVPKGGDDNLLNYSSIYFLLSAKNTQSAYSDIFLAQQKLTDRISECCPDEFPYEFSACQ